jgi:hypothetical protein
MFELSRAALPRLDDGPLDQSRDTRPSSSNQFGVHLLSLLPRRDSCLVVELVELRKERRCSLIVSHPLRRAAISRRIVVFGDSLLP